MLSTIPTASPLLSLIKLQDRGNLCYPKPVFVSILTVIHDFIFAVLPGINFCHSGIRSRLTSVILPHMKNIDIFHCNVNSHQHVDIVCTIVAEKFINPLLKNYAKQVTDSSSKTKTVNKPLCRKTLRL